MAKPSSTTTVPTVPQPVVAGSDLQVDLKALTDGQRTIVAQFLSGIGSWVTSVTYDAATLICRIKGNPEGCIERLHSAVTTSLSRPRPTPPRGRC